MGAGSGRPGRRVRSAAPQPSARQPASESVRRSVLDQASGLLAGRHGISLQQARAMLSALAQQHRTDEADVATTILGLASRAAGEPGVAVADEDAVQVLRELRAPDGADAAWQELRNDPQVRAAANARVVDSFLDGGDGDAAARLLVDLLGQDVEAVVVFAVRGGDRAELLGQAGFSAGETAPWRTIPLSLDTPLRRAYETRRPVLASTHEELVARFPALAGTSGRLPATAGVPVVAHDEVVGLIIYGWGRPRDFPPRLVERLVSLTDRVGAAMVRGAARPAWTGQLEEVLGVLAVVHDPWLVLDVDGDLESDPRALVVVEASPSVRAVPAWSSTGWQGRPLVGLWPDLTDDARLLQGLRRLVRFGGALHHDLGPHVPGPSWAPGGRIMRGVLVDGRLVVTCARGADPG